MLVDDSDDADASPFPGRGVFFSPPLEAGCGGSGLSRHVRSRLQLLHRAISNLVFEGPQTHVLHIENKM